jgi:hypothetical protein
LALFNLAIDSKLCGCDLVALRVGDVAPIGYAIDRANVRRWYFAPDAWSPHRTCCHLSGGISTAMTTTMGMTTTAKCRGRRPLASRRLSGRRAAKAGFKP